MNIARGNRGVLGGGSNFKGVVVWFHSLLVFGCLELVCFGDFLGCVLKHLGVDHFKTGAPCGVGWSRNLGVWNKVHHLGQDV